MDKNDDICIGDVVIHNTVRYIVVGKRKWSYYCLSADGQYLGNYFRSVLEKTGEHYPIEDILCKLIN